MNSSAGVDEDPRPRALLDLAAASSCVGGWRQPEPGADRRRGTTVAISASPRLPSPRSAPPQAPTSQPIGAADERAAERRPRAASGAETAQAEHRRRADAGADQQLRPVERRLIRSSSRATASERHRAPPQAGERRATASADRIDGTAPLQRTARVAAGDAADQPPTPTGADRARAAAGCRRAMRKATNPMTKPTMVRNTRPAVVDLVEQQVERRRSDAHRQADGDDDLERRRGDLREADVVDEAGDERDREHEPLAIAAGREQVDAVAARIGGTGTAPVAVIEAPSLVGVRCPPADRRRSVATLVRTRWAPATVGDRGPPQVSRRVGLRQPPVVAGASSAARRPATRPRCCRRPSGRPRRR